MSEPRPWFFPSWSAFKISMSVLCWRSTSTAPTESESSHTIRGMLPRASSIIFFTATVRMRLRSRSLNPSWLMPEMMAVS